MSCQWYSLINQVTWACQTDFTDARLVKPVQYLDAEPWQCFGNDWLGTSSLALMLSKIVARASGAVAVLYPVDIAQLSSALQMPMTERRLTSDSSINIALAVAFHGRHSLAVPLGGMGVAIIEFYS